MVWLFLQCFSRVMLLRESRCSSIRISLSAVRSSMASGRSTVAGTGLCQQLLPGGAVGGIFVDLPLFGPHGLAHGGKVCIALCPGKCLVQLRGGLFGHGVQLDLKLRGLAGELSTRNCSG